MLMFIEVAIARSLLSIRFPVKSLESLRQKQKTLLKHAWHLGMGVPHDIDRILKDVMESTTFQVEGIMRIVKDSRAFAAKDQQKGSCSPCILSAYRAPTYLAFTAHRASYIGTFSKRPISRIFQCWDADMREREEAPADDIP
ncbi:hypothetical protein GMORB2_0247 [Geosmithia morbida]|uniref:Uncharacterized protein n=1 Tax=Geosmithia morbida TaxID=1094350 RepID=A0A9P5D7D1_9HYPO|nr:uncharacterized protein GMORB2_0247 [Geosmithia morbida]KAF4126511.1 hypothetical protein GMORB2_0247 [Geosmithia morbida]